MKYLSLIFLIFTIACNGQPITKEKMSDQNQWNQLTDEEKKVIIHKGTEYPFTGKYYQLKDSGVFTCKQCNLPLFRSEDKFESGSGWPSFDDIIDGAVKEILDADGRRTEIVCNRCGGHLGHVFRGEKMTKKDTRHCVNSISLGFIPADTTGSKNEVAIFASGCFWGTEYYLQKLPGVIDTEVGYIGGHIKNPSYKEVCTGRTGHAEAVKVTYNPEEVDYETLARYFFETHDPTQVDRQGPDIGTQYRSEVFYTTEQQKQIAEKLIKILEEKGLKVATKVTAASDFYSGEMYHQDYYQNNGKQPYCHSYIKRF